MLQFPSFGSTNYCDIIAKEEKIYKDKIDECAKLILSSDARFVFLAGPSCSGKTTTALCLEKALLKEGKKVLPFSTDDFFLDQSLAPLNEDGTPNYDAFQHTDSDKIISVLKDLSQNKNTTLSTFDFVTGSPGEGRPVSAKDYDIFLLEGIHALNDKILSAMSEKDRFVCFYLDVTKSVKYVDSEGILSPVDIRFLRRMIRDYKHRNASLHLTWRLWKNVRNAEKDILHPFRKNANITISTSFSYEVSMEKQEAIPLLENAQGDEALCQEARRLLTILSTFPSLQTDMIPSDSVLREFID